MISKFSNYNEQDIKSRIFEQLKLVKTENDKTNFRGLFKRYFKDNS